MHLYVLIQDVIPAYGDPADCGINHWLGKNNIDVLEQYQWGHIRATLLQAIGVWGPEIRLEEWRGIPMSNLIAWRRVS